LNAILPALQSIEKKYPVTIRIISNKEPLLTLNSVEFVHWKKATEIPDLLKFDIGVMPLSDDEWAKGKCGFKALQYMSLGIPCLASPVGVNPTIITPGADGFCCSTPQEWEFYIEKLISDPSLRKKIGLAAREKVVFHYSVSSNTSNFFSLTRL
jgi:glycosyltransferase involved in cell wall biosynthesis